MLHYDYFILKIVQSKTDVYAKGNDINVARTSTALCPITWLTRYLVKANFKDDEKCNEMYLFRAVHTNVKSQHSMLRQSNLPLSYTTLSDMFKTRMHQIGADQNQFTLHSLRAGGVTLAARSGIPEKLYKSHGRWKSEAVRDYVTPDITQKLSVTNNMHL